MKAFLNENFLLDNSQAEKLYFDFAKDLPIVDYHNHLPPEEIFMNRKFDNLSQIWLNDDHYKWRAMRAFGIDEAYITGKASDKEKFMKWAETVPYTLRNPLYHWTHLELKRYFGITDLLNPESAADIFEKTSHMFQLNENRVQGLLQKMNVELVCTTDDPLDSLEFHQKNEAGITVLPTFRPDKSMLVDDVESYNHYLDELSDQSDTDINSYGAFIVAMKKRHDLFHAKGCRLSDHGLSKIEFEACSIKNRNFIFEKLRAKKDISEEESKKIKTAILLDLARMDAEKNWTQQFHLGPLRNTNTRKFKTIGPDAGFDSIGDTPQAATMAKFFDHLDNTNELAKTIIYNLNPSQNDVFAAMVGNFNDGKIKGKMQFGAAWWYADQLDGMKKQIDTLSNIGLLSNFVGMLTDSRSFLSFPRHEYFRRLLCNILGTDIENGLIPNDQKLVGEIVQKICYYNAKTYLNLNND